jgi:hypothetical protein
MRRFLALLAAAALPCLAGVTDMFSNHDLDVLSLTDFHGHEPVAEASKQEPIYYIPVNAGFKAYGASYAHEKRPNEKLMIHTILKVLATNGYLPATMQHPPTQVIVFSWGTMYTEQINLAGDKGGSIQINYSQKLAFVSGASLGFTPEKPNGEFDNIFLSGNPDYSQNAARLNSVAQSDLYVVSIGAYALKPEKKGRPQPLWTSHIACPAGGLLLETTLAKMVVLAGPTIGHRTKEPVITKAEDKFKGEVHVGDPVVEAYIDGDKMPVIDLEKTESPQAGEAKGGSN